MSFKVFLLEEILSAICVRFLASTPDSFIILLLFHLAVEPSIKL